MDFKTFTFFCAILLIKNTHGQCFRKPGFIEAAPISPFNQELQRRILELPNPSFSVESDALIISGGVIVNGRLPFVGAVEVEGIVPSVGQGSVLYKCGNGDIGIIQELPIVGPYRY